MPSPNLIQSVGGSAQKQTHFVSLFTSRFLIGLYTNRSPLRGPMSSLYSEFYHIGATDALLDGLNSELSCRSTMIRRPGNNKFSTVMTNGAIDSFYSFHQSTGTIQVIADSSVDVEVVTPTSITSLFTKTVGAGEGYFQGINTSLYIADGIDLLKYIPGGNIDPIPPLGGNSSLWNWSAGAPTSAPTLTVTETGAAAVAWQASTYFSTMGFLVDSNNYIQQLIKVNNAGSQFGTSGTGGPIWNQALAGNTTDNTVTWKNAGQVVPWTPLTGFASASHIGTNGYPSFCYDSITGCIFFSDQSATSGTTGTTRPNFSNVVGSQTNHDGTVNWFCIGSYTTLVANNQWEPSDTIGASVTILEPFIPPTGPGQPLSTQPMYAQVSQTSGTTGSSYTPWPATETAGNVLPDNQLVWYTIGPKAWAMTTAYVAWTSAYNHAFSAIVDQNGFFQVCIQSGTSGSSNSVFTGSSTYGSTTVDGTVKWVNVGSAANAAWTGSQQYFLPTAGFTPPSPSDPFGGSSVIDTNSNVEFVIVTGVSQTPGPPSWNATIGGTTTDNNITWINNGPNPANSFKWTSGYGYVYSFKSRLASDIYVTTAPPLGSKNTPPTTPLGAPTGAADGTVTTASPVVQIFGGNAGAIVTITGLGSTDPQFDTIEIYRSADGFGAGGPYLFLTDIAMPPTIGGLPGVWTIQDYMPDTATALLPGLNPLIEAPIDHVNDPPPGMFGSLQFQASAVGSTVPAAGTALQGTVYHDGRLWGFIGNDVYASGGPDTDPGNGFTAWPPINVFPFSSNVTGLLDTIAGLIVFTTTDIGIITGGPAISQYQAQILIKGTGVLSSNAITTVAGVPYAFTSDGKIISIKPNGGITREGHNVGNKLVLFNPSSVYLTYHSYGDQDNALFIADGSSQWYRSDLMLVPDGDITGPVWSPKATISGGFKAIQSIETSPGVHQMLIGPSSAGYILARDSSFSTFTDNGSAYESFFTMGCIVLANPGQMAKVDFIEMDFVQTGSQPNVKVLFDELSATNGAAFETISNSFVTDPPRLYGPTAQPDTLWMNRYYFGQTTPANINQLPEPAWCKFMQLEVDFGNTDTVQNELLAFTVFGAMFQEK